MKKEKLIAQLQAVENELRVAKANLRSRYCEAYRSLDKCGQDRFMGSGLMIAVRNINKTNPIMFEEVMIADGLSPETIVALKVDIKRSYDLTTDHPVNKFPKD